MKILLDTHLLLWAASSPNELSKEMRSLIEDNRHELCYSAASIWEIIIKSGLGREDFNVDGRVLRRNLLDNGYIELPIEGMHVVFIQNLLAIHKDPFDRVLIAQATVEGIPLYTSDTLVAQYPGPIHRV